MSHFAVSNSTLSTEQLAVFLRQKFGLPEKTTCKLLKTGINHTYLVDTGHEKFIYRVYSYLWRTETEILEEIRLLEELRTNNIAVSYALKDASGQYIQLLNAPEGDRPGVMFTYAPGEKLLNFPKEIHEKIGTIMARIHEITCNYNLKRINYDAETLIFNPLNHISKFLSSESAEMSFLLSMREVLLEQINTANPDELRKGAIHTDIWCDNLNILDDEKITIFDFDFCGNGWLVQDVAYYILQIKSTEKINEEYEEKKASFLKGYESVTPLTATEKNLIPTLALSCYYFYLGIQCQRYDNWSNVFLNENYLKRFISILLKGWFDYHDMGRK